MSRSKREIPAASSAPKRSPFLNADRRLRPALRLILSLAAWASASRILRLLLSQVLDTLFAAWNVNAGNVLRAPTWAQRLYAWQGSLAGFVVSAVMILLSLTLRRWWLGRERARGVLRPTDLRHAVAGWLISTLAALAFAGFFLLTDSLRAEWPVGEPNLTFGLVVLWLLNLLAALSEELFTKGVVMDGLRSPWGLRLAAAVSAVVFFLSNGGYAGTPVSAINVLLLGLLCCAVYVRHGLWPAVAVRWGWGFATVFLLGYSGGTRSVYRLYGVSERLLTGGDAGPVYGLWLTAVLLAALAWMQRDEIKVTIQRMRTPKAG